MSFHRGSNTLLSYPIQTSLLTQVATLLACITSTKSLVLDSQHLRIKSLADFLLFISIMFYHSYYIFLP